MRRRDDRDEGDIGRDHLGERLHFAGRADAGFDHRELVPRAVEPRERQRDTDVIIKVTLGGEHAVWPATEEEREKIFRRCLPRTAGNPNDFPAKRAAMFARDGLKRRERIADDKLRE